MNFLVYKRKPEGDIVYINPDNFIRSIESEGRKWIKYRHVCDNYCAEEIDPEFGIQIKQFKGKIGVI
jgi:hypothetical protein